MDFRTENQGTQRSSVDLFSSMESTERHDLRLSCAACFAQFALLSHLYSLFCKELVSIFSV